MSGGFDYEYTVADTCFTVWLSWLWHNVSCSRKKLYCAAAGGCLCWIIYLTAKQLSDNDYLSAYITFAVLSTFSEAMARVMKSPATVFTIIGIIPIIPGATLYQTMNALIMNDLRQFEMKGEYVILFSVSMAAGIALTATVFSLFERN